MKTHVRIATLALGVAATLTIVWFTKPAQKPSAAAAPVVSTGRPVAPPERSPADSRPYVGSNQFQTAFRLSDLETHSILDVLRSVQRDLAEQRGAKAQVLEFDGVTLRMFVPGLVLSESALLEAVEPPLSKVLSPEVAAGMVRDPIGRGFIETQLGLGRLGTDSWYTFIKLQNEKPASSGPESFARYNTTVRRVSAAGAPAYNGSEIERVLGQSLDSIASPYFMGQNATSKVPTDYFRPEEIYRVTPRPTDRLIMSVDDKGKATFYNLTSPGSRDELDLKDLNEPKKQ